MTARMPRPYWPRHLTAAAACAYLSLSAEQFRRQVAPHVRPVAIDGCVGYDRDDLDAWYDRHKAAGGRPARDWDGVLDGLAEDPRR